VSLHAVFLSFLPGYPQDPSWGLRASLSHKGNNLTADRSHTLTDPEGRQPGKREKQKQEEEYKKEKESRHYLSSEDSNI
jgi:uncharacterized protein YcbX